MRANIKKRLEEIESATSDWAAKLEFIDYIGLEDYDNGDWEELHFDETITAVRNRHSGKIRGVYNDRRTDDEILAMGGKLEYL